jgi:hypothetical protein
MRPGTKGRKGKEGRMKRVTLKSGAHLVLSADGDVADVVLLAELLAKRRSHELTALTEEGKKGERGKREEADGENPLIGHRKTRLSKEREREREREREKKIKPPRCNSTTCYTQATQTHRKERERERREQGHVRTAPIGARTPSLSLCLL